MHPAAPFASIDDDITAATLSALADITVIPGEGGAPFPAILDIADTRFFETARGCDWIIRYAARCPPLTARQTIHIKGSRKIDPRTPCQIIGEPTPLAGGREYTAPIAVRQDA
jgi:hypothetical protein